MIEIERRADDRGEYVVATCMKGRQFMIDATDLPILGDYRWQTAVNNRSAHCVYVLRSATRGVRLLHREIMQAPRGMTVDHRDGNGLNNRRYNLRVITRGQNISAHHNYRKSATGYRGVYQTTGGRFYALISIAHKLHSVGTFDTAEEAARAWDARAYAERGEFARLNFPKTP